MKFPLPLHLYMPSTPPFHILQMSRDAICFPLHRKLNIRALSEILGDEHPQDGMQTLLLEGKLTV